MVIGDREIDIDLLVRQILGDLRATAQPPSACAPAQAVVASPAPEKVTEKASEAVPEVVAIHLTDRVISLTAFQKAREANPTAKKVILSRGTVLTPLVRDALRKGAFELSVDSNTAASVSAPKAHASSGSLAEINALKRGYASVASPSSFGVAPVVLAFHQVASEVLPKPFLAEIERNGKVFQSPCLLETADTVERTFAEGTLRRAVLLTNNTGAACAVLNRHATLRALVGVSSEQVAQEAATFGANVLILHPKNTGLYQLRKMIQSFSQLGEPTVPKALRSFFENK